MQKLKIALSSPGMMGKKLKEAVNLVLESCEE